MNYDYSHCTGCDNLCGVLRYLADNGRSHKAARMACALDLEGYFFHLAVTVLYAAAVTAASIIVFKYKMKANLK